MWNTSSKLADQVFDLKFTSRQLTKESKRCEAAEKAEKLKVKAAMEKGNAEGARIYAQNAIRKRTEALNYLQLASRLDAVATKLDQQAKQQSIGRSMVGVVKTLNAALKSAPLDKMSATMDAFEKQFESLDVQTGMVDDAMNRQAALATPEDEVQRLMEQVADEHGLETRLGLPQAASGAVAGAARADAAPAERDELAERLAGLKRA